MVTPMKLEYTFGVGSSEEIIEGGFNKSSFSNMTPELIKDLNKEELILKPKFVGIYQNACIPGESEKNEMINYSLLKNLNLTDNFHYSLIHILYPETYKDNSIIKLFFNDPLNRVKFSSWNSFPDFEKKKVLEFNQLTQKGYEEMIESGNQLKFIEELYKDKSFLDSLKEINTNFDIFGLTRLEWMFLKGEENFRLYHKFGKKSFF